VVKSSFFVLFVRRFIQRTQKVYVLCFHSFFIFIGAYALDCVRINGFAHSTIIRIGNQYRYSIWLMYDKWGLHVGYILKLNDSWECGMHSLYPWKFAKITFGPSPPVHLPATFGGGRDTTSVYIFFATVLKNYLAQAQARENTKIPHGWNFLHNIRVEKFELNYLFIWSFIFFNASFTEK